MSEKLTITIPAGLMDSMFERFWDSEQDDVVDPNDAPLFTQVYFDTTMVLAHAAPEQAEKEPSPTQPNYYRFDAKGVSPTSST